MEGVLANLCAPVAAWWRSHFTELTAPQSLAIPAIQNGRNVLICAPTGSGKTLCAFISALSDLFARRALHQLNPGIQCVYISPLKALGNDVARNLLIPLDEIHAAYAATHVSGGGAEAPPDPIRVAQRTGDTSPRDRNRMSRHPPHILVTTPESLAICLANSTLRDHLRSVRTIIVDELHSVAGNKRGVDLSLGIERLSALVMQHGHPDPQRIGLSATIAPLETMAEFLVGPASAARACAIADASFDRPLDLEIASVFGQTPFQKSAVIHRHIFDTLEKIIRSHRTTLVFTNLRSATERVTFQLRKRFKDLSLKGDLDLSPVLPEHIEAHHSSVDREARLDIEDRLKRGQLRCVVCSTSLELGIDIGSIDRVVLLNSPKGVARGMQRVGRSGHHHGGTARGTFLPTVPGDLIESMVTASAMRQHRIDQIRVPRNCLDVLAQHLIGMALTASPHGIHTDDAFALVRQTLSFADLPRAAFDDVIHFIATQSLRDSARVSAKLWIEPTDTAGSTESLDTSPQPAAPPQLHGLLLPCSRGTLGMYAQNVGTITSEGQVSVRIVDGAKVGSVDEGFAQTLKPQDRFILAGRCVCFQRSEAMTIFVTESNGQQPTVPRWFGGMMSMEPGLASMMRDFRQSVRHVAPAGPAAIARLISRHYQVASDAAAVAAAFLHAQFRYADIPVDGQLLVERVPDDDAIVLVFHTMIGRAANDALARLVAYRMHKRFSGNATVVVDDYAFGIWVNQSSPARRADRTLIRSLLSPENFAADLAAAVESSELYRREFRFTAIRSHAILQRKFGRRRFIGQLQSYATKLHDALRDHHPDHLLLRETRRTVMDDILHASDALAYLHTLSSQTLRLLDLPTPSPFAFGLFAFGRRDSLHLADTADVLLAMYEKVQRRLQLTESHQPQASLFSM